ncbi:serine/threonine-protein kinase [Nocardioides litoris]|uniref:serine/threonine-protein kinase n=1 Tax=Nocardioides litoris TaxID=1926648 RepID=UPI0011231BCE|nr:serine/threonine-protein kinase [Nocardioides litoris]
MTETTPRIVTGSGPDDRYRLGEVLGRGGAADVHVAEDTVLHRAVAVKVLRETAGDVASRDRFVSEARTLARLSHPGIVSVLDAGFTGERPFLVLELVDGPTLAELADGVPLPVDRVARLGAQVAEALDHAHRRGVVHRDVKPSNVLVRGEVAKIADFGIARLVDDTVRHTRTGLAIGTAAYLAPEQVAGEPAGTEVDVYSLGLVLIELLTGARAFEGSGTEVALARLHRDPEVPRHVDRGWQRLLRAMTEREPSARPDAAAVAAALRARPVGLRDGAPEPTRVVPRPRLVDPPTVVLPTSTPTPAPTPAPTPTPAPGYAAAPAPAAPRRGRGLVWLVVAVLAVLLVVLLGALLAGGGSEPSRLPDGTPPELRQELQQLHDAIEGAA